jgi:hypothetical protein
VSDDEERVANIREIVGHLIGERVVDITQHDRDEHAEEGACYVALHFEGGTTIKFNVGADGFQVVVP